MDIYSIELGAGRCWYSLLFWTWLLCTIPVGALVFTQLVPAEGMSRGRGGKTIWDVYGFYYAAFKMTV